MKHTIPIAQAAAAVLLLTGSAPGQASSGDQESACGAILCLVGGIGVAACAPYLARYFTIDAVNPTRLFEKRLDFLNLCPAADLPGDVRPMIARYGATCQPNQLVSDLNDQIRTCQIHDMGGGDNCEPTGNEWRICAAFIDHGYTIYEPPRLNERCTRERDDDGYWTQRCSYTWTSAGSTTSTRVGALPVPSSTQWSGFEATLFSQTAD